MASPMGLLPRDANEIKADRLREAYRKPNLAMGIVSGCNAKNQCAAGLSFILATKWKRSRTCRASLHSRGSPSDLLSGFLSSWRDGPMKVACFEVTSGLSL